MAEEKAKGVANRSLWTGQITFGLVSIPVNLLPGNRGRPVSLRMLAPDGTPLRRRYFCPREDRMLSADEIVRGYEFERDRYVQVTDDELDALAPKKSREIDLRRFVPLEDVDRRYFNRAYVLVPSGDTKKAYLLLAEAMERNRRAGIATFVLRGREHLVAILAKNGILHAEVLHFADEIKSPEQLDLFRPDETDPDAVERLVRRIRSVRSEHLQKEVLNDPQAEQLLALAQRKWRRGQDVVRAAVSGMDNEEEEDGDIEPGAQVIDLMEILKRSLDLPDVPERGTPEPDSSISSDLGDMSRKELYEKAKEKNIAGRSKMSRKALVDRLRQTRS